jgi:hypothetical protein
MAFKLYKGNCAATAPSEVFIASGAIAIDMPVYLVAGASGAAKAKVAQCVGGAGATEVILGVAIHAVADTAEVLVQLVNDETQYVVDSAADANVSNAGADNYLTATTLTLVVGSSSANGKKCRIIGKLGTAAQRKYIVQLGNFGSDAINFGGSALAFTLDRSAAAFSTTTAIFTAPYAMRITDVTVTACAASTNGVATILKATNAIGTAITCAVDGVVARLAAGVVVANKAYLVLAAGDIVYATAGGDTAASTRAIITVFGHRI